MGLLTVGSPLNWEATIAHIESIKDQGVAQFLNLLYSQKKRSGDPFKWGDEIEYTIIQRDDNSKTVRVSCNAEVFLKSLQEEEGRNVLLGTPNDSLWRPEFGAFMVEGTPGVPYESFAGVEANMRLRRDKINQLLKKDEICLSITFPSLGVQGFTSPLMVADGDNVNAANSVFWPENAVFLGHPRFKNLSKNIRDRRGTKVAINVPIFKDAMTPIHEDFSYLETNGDVPHAKPGYIYMDHMGFGMGCCCLQTTFQAANLEEARWLYDQLTPLTPVMLALSAATPIFRGKLADVDCRWSVISESVDDRTPEERGLKTGAKNVIEKSRYDSTSCYLAISSEKFNDETLVYHEKYYQYLINKGVDPQMAKHVAHLFIRDPLQIFEERLIQNDFTDTEHFESIQSSNWNNMRFKPPPADAPGIGWRVEFRPMEIQLTDFENAAYCCFVAVLTRMMIAKKLDFLVPISLVSENMKRAQKRDAVLRERFFFRKETSPSSGEEIPEVVELTTNEIINGNDIFTGLAPQIKDYLENAEIEKLTKKKLNSYIDFISMRASGQMMTMASWIRMFVQSHAEYRQDSDVNNRVVYDLIKKMSSITEQEEVFAAFQSTAAPKGPADVHQ